ncbi:MAG: phage major capsid protein [Gammaproteobacteria bacterium]|nr:phage major capsid protein [Gammaproteobacteria bacterium]
MSEALAKAVENLGSSFEQFKNANDLRLAEVEKKGTASAELREKVDTISAAVGEFQKIKDQIDAIEAAANRGALGGGGAVDSKAIIEHSEGFNGFMRRGIDDGLRALEINAGLTTQSDPDGGMIVPVEVDKEIVRLAGTMSVMRSLATVRPVGSAVYKKIINKGGSTSGWVGEEETRSETNTPVLAALEFPTMELYAEPHATQTMLDDNEFNVESWLADEVAIEFVEQEGAAFITGNGVKRPRGILGYDTVANASWIHGKLGFVTSGAAADFAAAPDGGNALINLQHSLKSVYRSNGTFLMNDLTMAAVRQLKDGNGAYLWRPGIEAGASNTLLGKPVAIDDTMPDVAANAFAIAFGDFRRGYVITDRMGVRVLRDPYTNKPFVKFYTTKRVGGGVQNFQAIKLLKIAA